MKLQNLGVQELNAKEIREIDGGWWKLIQILIGAAVVIHESTCDDENTNHFRLLRLAI